MTYVSVCEPIKKKHRTKKKKNNKVNMPSDSLQAKCKGEGRNAVTLLSPLTALVFLLHDSLLYSIPIQTVRFHNWQKTVIINVISG